MHAQRSSMPKHQAVYVNHQPKWCYHYCNRTQSIKKKLCYLMQIQFIIARHYRIECNTQPCNAYLAVEGKLCHQRYSVIQCNSIHQALGTHYFQFVTKIHLSQQCISVACFKLDDQCALPSTVAPTGEVSQRLCGTPFKYGTGVHFL